MADIRRAGSPGSSAPGPDEVAGRTFAISRRGFDTNEVRAYLADIAAAMRAAAEREVELRRQAVDADERASHPTLDEDVLTRVLGEETARVLQSAREAATDIKGKAEDNVAALLRDAHDQASKIRAEAELVLAREMDEAERASKELLAAAESEAAGLLQRAAREAEGVLDSVRREATELVEEAQAKRARILGDLSRRRRLAHTQVEQLRAGRERLLEAYRLVRSTLDDVTHELTRAEVEARQAAEAAARRLAGEVLPEDEQEADGSADLGDIDGLEADERPDAETVAVAGAGAGAADPEKSEPASQAASDDAAGRAREGRAAESPVGRSTGATDAGAPAAGSGSPASATAPAPARARTDADRGASPALITTTPDASTRPVAVTRIDASSGAGDERKLSSLRILRPRRSASTAVTAAAEPRHEPGSKEGTAPVDTGIELVEPPSEVEHVRVIDRPSRDREAGEASITPIAPAAGGAPRRAAGAEPVARQSDAAPVDPVPDPADPAGPAEPAEPAAPAGRGEVEGGERAEVEVTSHVVVAELTASERLGRQAQQAPVDEPATAEPATIDGEDDHGSAIGVDDIFARIRAERAGAVARARAVLGTSDDVDGEHEPPEAAASEAAASEAEHAEPPAARGPAPEPADHAQPAARRTEAPSAAGATGAPGSGGAGGAGTDTGPADDADTDAGLAADTDAGAGPGDAAGADGDEALLQRRDQVLEPVVARLAKRLKRTLQDEQNDVLDRLRLQRGTPSASAVLPEEAEQVARFRKAGIDHIEEAAQAGVRFAGVGEAVPVPVDDLIDALAETVAGPLRRRLRRGLEAGSDEDASLIVERIGAAYREAKTQRVEHTAADHLIAAFSRGTLAAAGPGASLRWIVDDDGTPCPDCDDNVLAGPTPAGDEYPTGQAHPPAHGGCRCLLVVAPT